MSDRTVSFSELEIGNFLELGAGRPRSVLSDGYPHLSILRVGDVLDGKIESSGQENMPSISPNPMSSKVSRPGDVVLTTKGTVGRVALMPPKGPAFAYSPQLCYFRPAASGPLRSRYLYYWLKSTEFWKQADALKGQTDMADFLSLSDIQSLRIGLPPLEQQDGVVDILGTLDDKIAVNERIAATTDELASSMYAAFLTSRDNCKVVKLGEIADVNQSSIKNAGDGKLRYIDISSVGVGRYEWPELIPWQDAPGRARRKAAFGDTLWSTVRPNRRSHALVLDSDTNLVFSTGLVVLSPTKIGAALFYEMTRTEEFQAYLESVAEGSAYPAVRADRFASAPVVLPQPADQEKFEESVMPLRMRAHQGTVESRSLAALRDTLLPQLMSGKLRVRDAERIVGEAV